MVTLYGIANCDTVKKARRWLDEHAIDYHFHDYKKAQIQESTLQRWIAEVGWEKLLNRHGTTWRKLPETVKSTIDEREATRLMMEMPSIIKRPVLDTGKARYVGFKPEQYADIF